MFVDVISLLYYYIQGVLKKLMENVYYGKTMQISKDFWIKINTQF